MAKHTAEIHVDARTHLDLPLPLQPLLALLGQPRLALLGRLVLVPLLARLLCMFVVCGVRGDGRARGIRVSVMVVRRSGRCSVG